MRGPILQARAESFLVAGSLVRSVILAGAAERIRACGKRPAAIARRAGLPAEALTDPELLISGRAVMAFFDLAARACDRRNLGLEIAADAHLAAIIGPLWVLLRNTRSVRQMCLDLATNYDLYTSAALMRFEPLPGGNALLDWTASAGMVPDEVQVAEFALAVILAELRSHGPPGWHPVAVYFRHDAPRDGRMHRRVFGPGLRYNAEFNAIELDAAMLARPLRGAGEPRHRGLVHSMLRLQDAGSRSALRPQVEAILRALLPFGPSGMQAVASALGVSVRTLQERLHAEDSGFRAIKEAVRRDLAHKDLAQSSLSATQIAAVLGYTDATSFSRSFRRWNGTGIRRSRQSARHR